MHRTRRPFARVAGRTLLSVPSLLACALLAPVSARAQAPGGAATGSSATGSAGPDSAGGQLWEAKCSKCHGLDGKAHTKAGARFKIDDFTSAKWQKEMDDAEIRKTIQNGVKSRKGRVQMPPFQGKLDDGQIAALVAYVRTFGGK